MAGRGDTARSTATRGLPAPACVTSRRIMSACTMWPGRRTYCLPLRACACRRQRSRAGTTGARDAGGATDAYYMGPVRSGPSTVTRTDGAVHACVNPTNRTRSHPMNARHHLQHTYCMPLIRRPWRARDTGLIKPHGRLANNNHGPRARASSTHTSNSPVLPNLGEAMGS